MQKKDVKRKTQTKDVVTQLKGVIAQKKAVIHVTQKKCVATRLEGISTLFSRLHAF